MEIRFAPHLTSLPKVQKKKDQQGKGNAFEEALQGEEGKENGVAEATMSSAAASPRAKKDPKPRNGDGKGLKVDLLA